MERTPTIDSRAIPVTQRGRPSDPTPTRYPIRSQRSAAEQRSGAVERMIESIVVAVTPEPLAAVGGYVTREETD